MRFDTDNSRSIFNKNFYQCYNNNFEYRAEKEDNNWIMEGMSKTEIFNEYYKQNNIIDSRFNMREVIRCKNFLKDKKRDKNINKTK